LCFYFYHSSSGRRRRQYADGGHILNSVRMMIRGRGPKRDPKVLLAILNIDGDSIEGAVLRLDLITNIGIEHLQAGVRTAILAGELCEKRDPLMFFQLDLFPGLPR
jgi:hypothetical protein